MNRAFAVTTGIIIGAAATALYGIARYPGAQRTADKVKHNVSQATETISGAVNKIKDMEW